MRELARWLLLGGVLITLISQVRLAASAFSRSGAQGLMCLLVPGYVIYYARRYEERFLVTWFVGLGLIVLGTIFLEVGGAPPPAPAHTAAEIVEPQSAPPDLAHPAGPVDPECARNCRELFKLGQLKDGMTVERCEDVMCR